MKIDLRAAIVAAGVLAAFPAAAQQNQQTAPVHPGSSTIMQVQEKLNQQGFNAGQADGQWGLHTADAVRNYQQKHGLQATGSQTMQPSSSSGGNGQQQNPQQPSK